MYAYKPGAIFYEGYRYVADLPYSTTVLVSKKFIIAVDRFSTKWDVHSRVYKQWLFLLC